MRLTVSRPKDVAAGLVFIVLAAVFAYGASDLAFGTAVRMGPGYFPMVLAGLLALLGIVVLLGGLGLVPADAHESPSRPPVPWRGLALITVVVVLFGLTVRGLGLVPAVALTVILSAAASRESRPVEVVIFAVLLAAFCAAVFVGGLGLPIERFGRWIPALARNVLDPVFAAPWAAVHWLWQLVTGAPAPAAP